MSISRLMQMARAGVPAGDVWTDPDLANASYDSVSFSVAGQDASPFDCFFKPDGTKMYIVGQGNDALYQYTLSTAWDLSSASYDSVSFSLSAQDTATLGVFFKPDGTKFYIAGNTNNSIFEYDLSSAWDISTASYGAKSFSINAQDATPCGVFFKEDGLKMYVIGLQNDSVYQYSLSSAWDVSTASYDSKSISVTTQDNNPSGIFFNPDGTKIWVSGTVGDSVYQYSMSSAWDISTATYDSISFSVSTQALLPRGFFFKPDGSKMYITDQDTDTIYQYSTVTPAAPSWTDPDLANASYDSVSFSVAGQIATPTALSFKSDGTKVFVVDGSTDAVYQYSLSTAWDVSSASYDTVSFSLSTQETNPNSLTFGDDGTKMYVGGTTGNDSVYQYNLSAAWDTSTASYANKSLDVSAQSNGPFGLSFKPDGTKLFVLGNTNDSLYQYSLSTPWDVSTASYDSVSFSVSSQDSVPQDIFFNPTGTKFFIIGTGTDAVYQYSLSTAWDLSTASYDTVSFSVTTQEGLPLGISFKSDGSKMYVVGAFQDTIYQYSTD